jgi:hypothetical protein
MEACFMRTPFRNAFPALLVLAAASLSGAIAYGQQQQTDPPPAPPSRAQPTRSPGGDVGSGAGDIGKGAGGAAGNVAKGTGEGAGNLVTLHPVKGVDDLGKGVGKGAKDAGVGAAKGTGKIAKGTGRGIGHIFHHSHKDNPSPDSGPPAN